MVKSSIKNNPVEICKSRKQVSIKFKRIDNREIQRRETVEGLVFYLENIRVPGYDCPYWSVINDRYVIQCLSRKRW